ncbi:cytochrome P450 [Chthonobacter rhizosphaerae]|uniref:cytochrome P450 n=1 Tax=Chthonobacter rhizosphaerae TaxID=2735553 RepID=UPI0015EFAAED|nr:cytochrome P450 [Chthonobacter rhizosphaerae]
MSTIPEDRTLDATLALMREGYRFIPERCRRLKSDIFRTRLMLRPVICMQGAEAAEMFYGGGHFTRKGAMPQTTLRLLQDKGSVQTLDGAAHRVRKAMFLSMLSPDRVEDLAELMESEWRARLPDWELADRVVLLDAVRPVLTAAVCRWAGVPLGLGEIERRTRDIVDMISKAGSVGPQVVPALLRRRRTERWARERVQELRDGTAAAPEHAAARIIADHREDGRPLDLEVAAVELINILRPTVAVDRYIVFAALALHHHPEIRTALGDGDDAALTAFVQEVRRTAPFFPFIGGRALEAFTWRGHAFKPGDWVLLDLYGTDHDPRLWPDPERFRADRFLARRPSPYDLIPQGAGAHGTDHRCPGEWITIALMKRAVRLLLGAMTYDVPAQDLSVDLKTIPAQPASGFVLSTVRARR